MMRILVTSVLMLGVFACGDSALAQSGAQKAEPCKGETQREMTACAAEQLGLAESKMEALLKQRGIAGGSAEQKAWEAYRDAQLKALFPAAGTTEYGSVYPMCAAAYKKKLTEGRIRDLQALTTRREGDVCGGYKVAGLARGEIRKRVQVRMNAPAGSGRSGGKAVRCGVGKNKQGAIGGG